MNKYIDAEKLIAELRRQKHELELSIRSQGDYGQSCHIVAYENIISLITSLQQKQPDDLASLISEATNTAKRIVDRDSFYNSLPQNLRNRYTFEAWCEILEALSTAKGQEQSEVDLDAEIAIYLNKSVLNRINNSDIIDDFTTMEAGELARHFAKWGAIHLNARKEE